MSFSRLYRLETPAATVDVQETGFLQTGIDDPELGEESSRRGHTDTLSTSLHLKDTRGEQGIAGSDITALWHRGRPVHNYKRTERRSLLARQFGHPDQV